MTSGASRNVEGIGSNDPNLAEDNGCGSGMTLGAWLNQVALEDSPPRTDRPPAAPGPVPEERLRPQHEAFGPPSSGVSAAAEALDRPTMPIEASEIRATPGGNATEQSVADLAARLAAGEEKQTGIFARIEGMVDALRVEQSRVLERLRRIEDAAEVAQAIEPAPSVKTVLVEMADQLKEFEQRTSHLVSGLRDELGDVNAQQSAMGAQTREVFAAALGRLANRLELAEARNMQVLSGLRGSPGDIRQGPHSAETPHATQVSDASLLQRIGDLSARVDALEQVHATMDGRFERLEAALWEMHERVVTAGQCPDDAKGAGRPEGSGPLACLRSA